MLELGRPIECIRVVDGYIDVLEVPGDVVIEPFGDLEVEFEPVAGCVSDEARRAMRYSAPPLPGSLLVPNTKSFGLSIGTELLHYESSTLHNWEQSATE